MYIAMNRFRVRREAEADFERMWLTRETYLHREPGFTEFRMLKGPAVEADGDTGEEAHRLYVSHTVWASEDDFLAWTRSDSFRAAHAQAGRKPADAKPLYLGGPRFEGFATIQTVDASGTPTIDRQRLADGVRDAANDDGVA